MCSTPSLCCASCAWRVVSSTYVKFFFQSTSEEKKQIRFLISVFPLFDALHYSTHTNESQLSSHTTSCFTPLQAVRQISWDECTQSTMYNTPQRTQLHCTAAAVKPSSSMHWRMNEWIESTKLRQEQELKHTAPESIRASRCYQLEWSLHSNTYLTLWHDIGAAL